MAQCFSGGKHSRYLVWCESKMKERTKQAVTPRHLMSYAILITTSYSIHFVKPQAGDRNQSLKESLVDYVARPESKHSVSGKNLNPKEVKRFCCNEVES